MTGNVTCGGVAVAHHNRSATYTTSHMPRRRNSSKTYTLPADRPAPQFHLNCRAQAPGFAKFSPVDLSESGYALKILLDMHFAYS